MFERQKDLQPLPLEQKIAMAIVVIAIAGLILVGVMAHQAAHAEWHGPVGPYHEWFLAQRQDVLDPTVSGREGAIINGGPCCGDEEHVGGDGHYVDVRSIGGGKYEVFVREVGQWVLFPLPVKWHENPTGQNVAWYTITPGEHGQMTINWYCLRLAEGT